MKKAFFVMLVLGLVSCTKEPTPTSADSNQSESSAEKVFTLHHAMDAMLRGHPGSLQVCYNSEINGYLIEYKRLPPGAEVDNYFHGWLLLQNVKFYPSNNNSYFIEDISPSYYVKVFPDTTGLHCKLNDTLLDSSKNM